MITSQIVSSVLLSGVASGKTSVVDVSADFSRLVSIACVFVGIIIIIVGLPINLSNAKAYMPEYLLSQTPVAPQQLPTPPDPSFFGSRLAGDLATIAVIAGLIGAIVKAFLGNQKEKTELAARVEAHSAKLESKMDTVLLTFTSEMSATKNEMNMRFNQVDTNINFMLEKRDDTMSGLNRKVNNLEANVQDLIIVLNEKDDLNFTYRSKDPK